jgi:hypothetical protein
LLLQPTSQDDDHEQEKGSWSVVTAGHPSHSM